MKKFLLCLWLPGLLLGTVVSGQTLSSGETVRYNARALDLITSFSQSAAFAAPEDAKSFVRLFAQADSACVVQDIPGLPGYGDMCSPRTYAGMIRPDGGNMLNVTVFDVRKEGDWYWNQEGWHRRISLSKRILFIDSSVYSGGEGGVFFAASQDPGSDAEPPRLLLDLVYDAEADRCLLSSVRAAQELPTSPLRETTFSIVLQPEDAELAEGILIDGKPLVFDEYGQAIVPTGQRLAYASDRYAVRQKELASSALYNVRQLSFRPLTHLFFKPRAAMTVGGAFGCTSLPQDVAFECLSAAKETGLDIGLHFSSADFVRSGLFVGAAYSWSTAGVLAKNIDTEGCHILQATEGYSFQDMVFPLYLELEFRPIERLRVSLDAGAKCYVNREHMQSSLYTVVWQEALADGTWEDVRNLHRAWVPDPSDPAKRAVDLSFFGNLEIAVRLTKQLLWAFLSVGYEYGFPSLLPAVQPEAQEPWYDASGGVFPVKFDTDELQRQSFTSSVALHRQGCWISAGLKIKLDI